MWMHLPMKLLFKLVSLLIGVTLVGGMLVFFNLNRAAIYNELATLDLIPKPEKLTELYFKDHVNLPHSATSNEKISFAFVIHNLEAIDFQYTYAVSVSANGTRHIVDSGKVLVKDDQYYVKNEQFNLLNTSGIQEIAVELPNKQQSIHFRTGGKPL
jgi:hypothetical protein